MDGTGPQLIANKSVSKAQVQITGKITAIEYNKYNKYNKVQTTLYGTVKD